MSAPLDPGNALGTTENAPASGREAGAGMHASGRMRRDSYRSDLAERKGGNGSYEASDPDRPEWTRETQLEREFKYHHADGGYSFSVLKGRREDGEKVFLRGRAVFSMSELGNAQHAGETYRFPEIDNFLKGTGSEPDLLYRLPELHLAMTEPSGDPIYICEGEKDVDRLWAEGLLATTNANGALNWKLEFNSAFAGRDVVILQDNDDKGRKRTANLLPQLLSVARSVRVVDLPGLPPCGDVSDWLDVGNTADDLRAIVANTEPVTDPEAWAAQACEFGTDKHGKPYASPANARLSLAKMGVAVRYDEFADRYLVAGLEGFGPVLDDAALTRLRLTVEERWHITFGKERWWDIVTDQARRNSFHPVRQYLDGLSWDGQPRIDGWLGRYAKAEDNEYVRAVGLLVLIAAVRRVRKPGCKFDQMLVLESRQGTGKSSALSILAVIPDWFTDDLPLDSDSKVVMERTVGCWIVELAELKGMRRGAVEHVKAVVSRQVDKARPAYGHMTVERPRQCVFFGTTNDGAYLRDMTGNRRFWPVKVGKIDLVALRRDRDQLWAEAAHREAKGESIELPEKLWAQAGLEQAKREVIDPIFETLSERLDGLSGKVRASDIWEMIGLGDKARRTQDHNMRLPAAMQRLGWSRPASKLRFGGSPQHAWVKGEDGFCITALSEVPRKDLFGPDAVHVDDERPM